MNYFFAEAAASEHLEQVAYYEEQHEGLGARYLAAFERAMQRVCEHPERFAIEAPPAIRRVGLPGFPFNVLYRVVGTEIEVLAIAHHRRRPGYWTPRT